MENAHRSLKARSRIEARFVALLSLTEMGLGSLLHVFHVPLGGHFLSLNQALLLNRCVIEDQEGGGRASQARKVSRVSMAAALLKSFSPAGKVLTPMLAISLQGLLHAVGILILGGNFSGLALASALLSLWGILQPWLLGTLFYGRSFVEALVWSWKKTAEALALDPQQGGKILMALVLIKVSLGILTVFLARWDLSRSWNERLGERGRRLMLQRREIPLQKADRRQILWGVLRDLRSPFYLGSFVLMGIFLYASNPDSSGASILWPLLRSLATAFLLFYGVRSFSAKNFRLRLQRWSPALAGLVGDAQAITQATTQATDWKTRD